MISLSSFPGCCHCCCCSVREFSRCLHVLLDTSRCIPWIRDPRHIAAYRFRSPRSNVVAFASLVATAADFEFEMLIYPSISRASLCVSVLDAVIYLLRCRLIIMYYKLLWERNVWLRRKLKSRYTLVILIIALSGKFNNIFLKLKNLIWRLHI